LINIVVLFPKLEEAKGIKSLLSRHGYTVVAACTTGAAAINALEELEDGIVVCGYKYPDMTYMQLREYMPQYFDMLLISSPAKISECMENDIVCLVMPLKVNDLINTIEMMEQTIYRRRKKLKSVPKTRNEEDKAVIEEAKKVLMEKNNMTEPEAHRYIQKTSMDTGNTMLGTAKMVLEIMLR
jgi:AmiR/NasT family two-component response regulator